MNSQYLFFNGLLGMLDLIGSRSVFQTSFLRSTKITYVESSI